MTLIVPAKRAAICFKTPERRAWLEELPNAVRELLQLTAAICAALMVATNIMSAVMLRRARTGAKPEPQANSSPITAHYRPIGGPHEG